MVLFTRERLNELVERQKGVCLSLWTSPRSGHSCMEEVFMRWIRNAFLMRGPPSLPSIRIEPMGGLSLVSLGAQTGFRKGAAEKRGSGIE
jgi:hypothetical protein